jgi:3-oxosteroid 1-dehydrogenase
VTGTDLVVVGSGGAGLVAALTAARAGLAVTVVESSDRLGGTTALSGGLVFAPGNPLATAEGHTDSRKAVSEYLHHVARVPLEDAALDTFLDTIPEVVGFLLDAGVPLRTSALQDYYRDAPGAAAYRSIAFQPCDPADLGERAATIRVTPYRPVPDGEPWTNGMALVGHLVRVCHAAGVEFRTGWRATGLELRDGAVTGVRGTSAGSAEVLRSARGVVLAAGGFEFAPDLLQAHVNGTVQGAWSCPANMGDALRMAEKAGAAVSGFDVQWYPLLRLSDETREGAPLMHDATPARNLPGSMIVDARGKRVVNESALYQDVGRALGAAQGPCWLVIDDLFRETYGQQAFGTAELSGPHWVSAPSAVGLSSLLGIDEAVFEGTLVTFNKDADEGCDRAFNRGASEFDQSWGDSARSGPQACLGPLHQAPLYATRMYAGCSGTTGGPVIDHESRVLSTQGAVIPGLWAAGNAVANPFGGVAPSSGGTLGPGFSTGYRAGVSAAG